MRSKREKDKKSVSNSDVVFVFLYFFRVNVQMIMTAMLAREGEGDRDEKLWMARGGFGHWKSGLCAQTGRDPGKGANGDAVIPMPRIRVKF